MEWRASAPAVRMASCHPVQDGDFRALANASGARGWREVFPPGETHRFYGRQDAGRYQHPAKIRAVPERPWRFNTPFLNSSPFVRIRVSVFAVTLAWRFIRLQGSGLECQEALTFELCRALQIKRRRPLSLPASATRVQFLRGALTRVYGG